MNTKTIAIGCDHAGWPYKSKIVALLEQRGIEIIDHGTYSEDSVDYPDFVHPTAKEVISGKADRGILICGSGNGVAMTANKYKEIRAALCWNSKIAGLARQHNNANMVAIPARFISQRMANMIVRTFLDTAFEGGRHQRRIDKINMC